MVVEDVLLFHKHGGLLVLACWIVVQYEINQRKDSFSRSICPELNLEFHAISAAVWLTIVLAEEEKVVFTKMLYDLDPMFGLELLP